MGEQVDVGEVPAILPQPGSLPETRAQVRREAEDATTHFGKLMEIARLGHIGLEDGAGEGLTVQEECRLAKMVCHACGAGRVSGQRGLPTPLPSRLAPRQA